MRITDPEQLKGMSPGVRAQFEAAMADQAAPSKLLSRRPEEDAGRELIAWADWFRIRDPIMGSVMLGLYLAHIPNGLARNATEGGIFKAQGLRKAWPDYILALPRGRFHGAYLELKATAGAKPTEGQLDVLLRLQQQGYHTMIAWGFGDARDQLIAYEALGENDP